MEKENNIIPFPVPVVEDDEEEYEEEYEEDDHIPCGEKSDDEDFPEGVIPIPSRSWIFFGNAPYLWQRTIAFMSLDKEKSNRGGVIAGTREINRAYQTYYDNFENKDEFETNYYSPFYETVWEIAHKYEEEDCQILLDYAIKAFIQDMTSEKMIEEMQAEIDKRGYPFEVVRRGKHHGWVVMKKRS